MSSTVYNIQGSTLEGKAAELRRRFDEQFASPPPEQAAPQKEMLAITVQGERYAIRVSEINGLAVPRGKILPVPSSVPELLGLTGMRGVVVPVFSLASLLGFAQGREVRWLVFCGSRQAPIALAFDEMQRQFTVAAGEIYPRPAEFGVRRYVGEAASDGEGLRGVVSIPPIVEYIKSRGATSSRATS
jgi:chemotaxis signal transduction protein